MEGTETSRFDTSLKDSLDMAASAVTCLRGQACEADHFTNKIVGAGGDHRLLFDELYGFL